MSRPRTLPQALQHAAREYADRTAVVDGDVRLTFADLHERVRSVARGYLATGVRPGDRVCLWAPNAWEWIVAGLAITYAGATLVPLNTRYKGHEVVDIAARTGATTLVLADGFLGRAQLEEVRAAAAEEARARGEEPGTGTEAGIVPGLPALRTVVRIGEGAVEGTTSFADLAEIGQQVPEADLDAIAAAVSPDDVADILFTSGTTGRPKGVMTAHRQTLSAAEVWGDTTLVTPEDRYLVISPFFHSYGYKVGILVMVVHGCALYPMAAFDTDAALDLVERERISIVPGAPTIFYSLLESPRRAEADLSSLRLANIGAAAIPKVLIQRMQHDLGFEMVVPAFGMTECVVATMCSADDPLEVKAATNGRAVEGLELRIADLETGADCPPGTEGEVLFRGPMVMLGYLDDEEATAEAIDADGWLHTGDVGTLDEHGNLKITDRLKDMYISGGFNVYPAEVEKTLARLDGVVESAVVGVPDERMGEVGRAYVVRAAGSDLTEADVVGFLRERLANFKVPRSVAFVDDLPRNLSGKVLKNELRNT